MFAPFLFLQVLARDDSCFWWGFFCRCAFLLRAFGTGDVYFVLCISFGICCLLFCCCFCSFRKVAFDLAKTIVCTNLWWLVFVFVAAVVYFFADF